MPVRKTFISISILFALVYCGSLSQEKTSHAAAAAELLNMMNMEKNLQQTIALSLETQIQANTALRPYEDVMKKFLSKYMGWQYLKDKFVKIYMEEFTEEDLQVMIKFYKTETGKKAIEKLPVLMQKGAAMGQKAVQDHMAELEEEIAKRQKELGN